MTALRIMYNKWLCMTEDTYNTLLSQRSYFIISHHEGCHRATNQWSGTHAQTYAFLSSGPWQSKEIPNSPTPTSTTPGQGGISYLQSPNTISSKGELDKKFFVRLEQAVEQIFDFLVIWNNAILMWYHCSSWYEAQVIWQFTCFPFVQHSLISLVACTF